MLTFLVNDILGLFKLKSNIRYEWVLKGVCYLVKKLRSKIFNDGYLLDTKQIDELVGVFSNKFANKSYDIYIHKDLKTGVGKIFRKSGLKNVARVSTKYFSIEQSMTAASYVFKEKEIHIFENKLYNHILKYCICEKEQVNDLGENSEVVDEWATQILAYVLLKQLAHTTQRNKYLGKTTNWREDNAERRVRKLYLEEGSSINKILKCNKVKVVPNCEKLYDFNVEVINNE